MTTTSNTKPCIFSMFLVLMLVVLFLENLVIHGVNSNKIRMLPDQPKVRLHQFAGHIAVDHETHHRSLFYYFVEAGVDPTSKPVVLWLYGGPGCSSVGQGVFSEHGLFWPTTKGIVKNPSVGTKNLIIHGVNFDKIRMLPDQPKVRFNQFAGHIAVDHETHHRSLFYYFVEAEVDPTSKPVVL